MNKSDLSAAVAEKHGLSQTEAERVVNTVVSTMKKALSNNERIQLLGFGSFEVVDRAERTITNPQTKEKMTIPATKAVRFKAGKDLKEMVK